MVLVQRNHAGVLLEVHEENLVVLGQVLVRVDRNLVVERVVFEWTEPRKGRVGRPHAEVSSEVHDQRSCFIFLAQEQEEVIVVNLALEKCFSE